MTGVQTCALPICTGIDFNEKKQLELLEICLQNFNKEYNNFPMEQTSIPYEYYRRNGTFSTVDAEILYSFIRYFKPKKIIEIGSGKSTFLSAQAIIKNKNLDSTYTCNFLTIDLNMPKVIENGFPGLTRVINKEVQDVSMSEFTDLKENDILFIDSSHILKTGSDVQYEYLEILPKLNKGVIIHAHDIFIPSEYPKDFIYKRHEFWTEQYLVQAFLMFNKDFEILWAGNYMNLKYPEKLESAFKTYIKHHSWPVSLWMRKIK